MKKYLILLLLMTACGTHTTPELPKPQVPESLKDCKDDCLQVAASLRPEEVSVLYGGVVAKSVGDVRVLRTVTPTDSSTTTGLTVPGNAADPRSNFTTEFLGRPTKLAIRETGKCRVVNYTTQFGLYKRNVDPIPLDLVANDPSNIPTAPLSAEHFHMSFELLMKGQHLYGVCVGALAEVQKTLNYPCPYDQPCSPLYDLISDLLMYWPPWNVVDNFHEFPPGKLTYQEHFRAGALGVNQIVAHLEACRSSLKYWRTFLP